jgi:hypothetical protein
MSGRFPGASDVDGFWLQPGIAYVRIGSFSSQNTGEEVEAKFRELGEDRVKGLILDLRNNQGGLVSECVAVAGRFLEKGQTVVSHRGRASALARTRHPGAKHSLDALCVRFGIDRSHRVKHGALIDAQLLAQVYVELTGGRQIGLSLATTTLAPDSAPSPELGAVPIVAKVRPPRAHSPSAEELDRHAAFVAWLSDPIWARLDAAQLTQSRDGA